jgi:hypothetical protein
MDRNAGRAIIIRWVSTVNEIKSRQSIGMEVLIAADLLVSQMLTKLFSL